MIEVKRTAETDPPAFDVVLREGRHESRHRVTLSRETCRRLTGGEHGPEACIEAAFRFLLEREPKESLLQEFDISAIPHYFPEFERELVGYLPKA